MWLTQCVLQWMAQLALVANLTQALIVRTDLPTHSTLATHECHSLKKMMTASCTLITRGSWLLDIVSHRNNHSLPKMHRSKIFCVNHHFTSFNWHSPMYNTGFRSCHRSEHLMLYSRVPYIDYNSSTCCAYVLATLLSDPCSAMFALSLRDPHPLLGFFRQTVSMI